MRGAARLLALLLVAWVPLAGCQHGDDWNPTSQFAPSLRPAFGARVDQGQLRIWTGSPCVVVTRLAVIFDLAGDQSTPDPAKGPART